MTLDDEISRRDFINLLTLGTAGAALFPSTSIAQQQTRTPPIQTIVVPPGRWVDGNHGFITIAQADRYRADVVTGEELTGIKYYFETTQWIRDKTGAYVCFNGSLFRNKDAASGLEVHNGKEKMPYVQSVGDGVLFTDKNGQIHIIPIDIFIRDFKIRDGQYGVNDALQLNLLHYNGQRLYAPNENDKKIPRNLIGLTKDGDLVDIIFKNTNFTLGDRYMRQQHRCVIVGALDGDTSASAFDEKRQSSYIKGLDIPEIKVPNFIVLYRR